VKKDINQALRHSLRAEEDAVGKRFERAEKIFGEQEGGTDLSSPIPSVNRPEVNRVIRDSFTMPADEYHQIAQLQDRCLKAGIRSNKSELIRAGLSALQAMADEDFMQIVHRLPKVKTGRPAQP